MYRMYSCTYLRSSLKYLLVSHVSTYFKNCILLLSIRLTVKRKNVTFVNFFLKSDFRWKKRIFAALCKKKLLVKLLVKQVLENVVQWYQVLPKGLIV